MSDYKVPDMTVGEFLNFLFTIIIPLLLFVIVKISAVIIELFGIVALLINCAKYFYPEFLGSRFFPGFLTSIVLIVLALLIHFCADSLIEDK